MSIEDVWAAYYDCRKRKRNTMASGIFELHEAQNIAKLWRELNDGTYEIGYSDAFVVTRPKLREIFAADFRDRIVHHLLMMRTMYLFEEKFIPDTYNCRKGKGTTYGVNRIQEKIRRMSKDYTSDCWILKCDLRGFFMSIDKPLLAQMLEDFLEEKYHGEDKEFVIRLTKQVVLHQPELRCRRKGDLALWDKLDKGKSLFNSPSSKGLAIGNLTSQIYANFYLSYFDEWMVSHKNIDYGRYVDDFIVLAKTKEELLRLIPEIRDFLERKLKVSLHPDKVYLQHFSKGVRFIGTQLKYGRMYAGNRLVGNAFSLIREWNKDGTENNVEKFAQRYNSFMGFLVQVRSYRIRRKAWDLLDDSVKQYTYIAGDMRAIKVRNKYKHKNKILYELRKSHSGEGKVRRVGAKRRGNVCYPCDCARV